MSRISPSPPSRTAWRMASRSSSMSSFSPPSNRFSVSPRWIAAASGARKKKRSNTASNTSRSSCDLAIVVASASLKTFCSVQLTSASAANASSSSLVPTARPSLRISSASSSRRGGSPGGPGSGIPP